MSPVGVQDLGERFAAEVDSFPFIRDSRRERSFAMCLQILSGCRGLSMIHNYWSGRD